MESPAAAGLFFAYQQSAGARMGAMPHRFSHGLGFFSGVNLPAEKAEMYLKAHANHRQRWSAGRFTPPKKARWF
ncbi:MAG TPA: hypothetical protein VFS80_08160 [Burkholderiales bacterium]|nr:hypothetical protein [Burkholderiales bacterium]